MCLIQKLTISVVIHTGTRMVMKKLPTHSTGQSITGRDPMLQAAELLRRRSQQFERIISSWLILPAIAPFVIKNELNESSPGQPAARPTGNVLLNNGVLCP